MKSFCENVKAIALVIAISEFAAVFRQPFAFADGWHNASLATASLDDWLRDVKAVIPDLPERLNRSELSSGKSLDDLRKMGSQTKAATPDPANAGKPLPGGKLQANLTREQQALLARKAGDCLEILAFMDPKNIFPAEFPRFQLGKIPEYRTAAKQMLKAMGDAGGTSIANHLASELMGQVRYARDVSPTVSYYGDLVEVFRDLLVAGQISLEEIEALKTAASGQKPEPQATLAKHVQETLDKHVGLSLMLKWLQAATDARRKADLTAKIRDRLAKASAEELLSVLAMDGLGQGTRNAVVAQLAKTLPTTSLLDLFQIAETAPDAKLKNLTFQELESRSPKFGEVRDDLPTLVTYLSSKNPQLRDAARSQLANAFVRAPLAECLRWSAGNDKQLRELIWEQIDARIERADAARKESYKDTAAAMLGDADEETANRAAALELLARLRDRSSVGPILNVLSQLPRELWPTAGKTLEQITGQKFGPKATDGAAEVSVAIKKWREWFKANGGS